MPKMNYAKLLGRIKERGETQKSVAEKVGISESQFSQKISGNYPFKQTDIQKICELLDVDFAEVGKYFFCPLS
jgi:transcriptional regulator with XRE-family HTH domain